MRKSRVAAVLGLVMLAAVTPAAIAQKEISLPDCGLTYIPGMTESGALC